VGTAPQHAWLLEVVANKRNGLDVDKLDYFARDSRACGMTTAFDSARLLRFCRVVPVPGDARGATTVAVAAKEAWNVAQLYAARYSLHKRAYQHAVVRGVEALVRDALVAAAPVFTVPGAGGAPVPLLLAPHDMAAWANATDWVLRAIEASAGAELAAARAPLRRVATRQLRRCVGAADANRCGEPTPPRGVLVEVVDVGTGGGADGVDGVWGYAADKATGAVAVALLSVTDAVPRPERPLRVYADTPADVPAALAYFAAITAGEGIQAVRNEGRNEGRNE
jgi:hypothetical protein